MTVVTTNLFSICTFKINTKLIDASLKYVANDTKQHLTDINVLLTICI